MASKTILNMFNSTSCENSTVKLKKKDFELAKKYLKELLLIFESYEESHEPQSNLEVTSGFVISEVNVVQLKAEPEFYNEDEIVNYEPNPTGSEDDELKAENPESTSISYSNLSLSTSSSRQQPAKRRRVLSKSSSSPTVNSSSHKKSPQKSSNKIKCEKCDEFVPKTGWRNHVYEHKYKDLGRVFTCTICDYASFIKRGIKSHLLNFHKTSVELNDLKPVVLEPHNLVLITLKHKENLRQLRAREKKVECPVCSETISVNYLQHFNEHEIENLSEGFRCSLCVFSAPSQYYLMNHMKSAHGILMDKKRG